MDDLEFRRRAYAQPNCQNADFIEYKNRSVENVKFVEDLLSLDNDLEQALNISVPNDLAEKIKLNQTLLQHQVVKRRWRLGSIAASVLIISAIMFNFFERAQINLHQQVLMHVYEELNHLYDRDNKTLLQVNTLLEKFNVKMSKKIAQINYLGSCDIANKRGVHLIVQGDLGPITILMLPKYSISSQQLIRDERFQGMIVPSGEGSMAIIGERGESLQQLRVKLDQFLDWI